MRLSYDPQDESSLMNAFDLLIEALAELSSPGYVAEHLKRLARELEEAQERLDHGNPWGE
ncbi:MAG: hypothetical protein ACE5I9_07350 [Candidatus Methylomirabilales bacterium]